MSCLRSWLPIHSVQASPASRPARRPRRRSNASLFSAFAKVGKSRVVVLRAAPCRPQFPWLQLQGRRRSTERLRQAFEGAKHPLILAAGSLPLHLFNDVLRPLLALTSNGHELLGQSTLGMIVVTRERYPIPLNSSFVHHSVWHRITRAVRVVLRIKGNAVIVDAAVHNRAIHLR